MTKPPLGRKKCMPLSGRSVKHPMQVQAFRQPSTNRILDSSVREQVQASNMLQHAQHSRYQTRQARPERALHHMIVDVSATRSAAANQGCPNLCTQVVVAPEVAWCGRETMSRVLCTCHWGPGSNSCHPYNVLSFSHVLPYERQIVVQSNLNAYMDRTTGCTFSNSSRQTKHFLYTQHRQCHASQLETAPKLLAP